MSIFDFASDSFFASSLRRLSRVDDDVGEADAAGVNKGSFVGAVVIVNFFVADADFSDHLFLQLPHGDLLADQFAQRLVGLIAVAQKAGILLVGHAALLLASGDFARDFILVWCQLLFFSALKKDLLLYQSIDNLHARGC
ncbi:MAG: hypothetical protein WKF30_19130, partial [Pyrinomonadaceae bacterium]